MAKYFCGIDWYGSRPWIYKHLGFTATIIDHFSSPNGFPEGLAGDADGNVISGDENRKIYKHDGFSSTVIDSFSRYQSDITWYDSNLYSVLGTKVYKHSGFSASITDSFSSTQQIATTAAWDGSNICETSYTDGMPVIIETYKHNGFSSSVIESFAGHVGAWMDSYGGNLYGIDSTEEQYDRMNGFSNSVNFSIAMPEGQSHGLAWIEGEPLFDSGIRMFGGATVEFNIYSIYSYINKKIFKYDGFSSSILDSFSTPGSSPAGLTWGEDNINIISNDYTTDKIYKHDGFSSSIIDSFGFGNQIKGLAWDQPNLLSAEAKTAGGTVYKHDGFSSSILDQFNLNVGYVSLECLGWDGANVLAGSRNYDKIYKQDGFSNTIIDSFSFSNPNGLDWGGGNLYACSEGGAVYKFDGFSSVVLGSFGQSYIQAVAYKESPLDMIAVGYRDLKSTHKLRYNKGGTTVVGIPLVESADPVASKIRVFDGSAFKSIAKYEV